MPDTTPQPEPDQAIELAKDLAAAAAVATNPDIDPDLRAMAAIAIQRTEANLRNQ